MQSITFNLVFAAALLADLATVVNSFNLVAPSQNVRQPMISSSLSSSKPNEIDISDLGLTMDDFNAPLPSDLIAGIESSGYDSTSRNVDDQGCQWTENQDDLDVILTIPGLRGQPAACLSVLFSTTTISVTAFGRVVWSCIQRGISNPDECTFLTQHGDDMIPVIQLSVKKEDSERWGGFIRQIGEDSIL